MKARVFITLKNGVLDPQGKAIGHALNGLGFGSVGEVRQGKVIDLELSGSDAEAAKADLKAMCEKLLANTVIEKYEIELKLNDEIRRHRLPRFQLRPRCGGRAGADDRQDARTWSGTRTANLPDVDLVVLPGGFSYGDYLRCGAMASQSRDHARGEGPCRQGRRGAGHLQRLPGADRNAGLLPGALMRNAGLKFVCKPVALEVEETQSGFTRKYDKGQRVTFPVAHGEGNYFADDETLDRLEGESRVVFRYARARIPTARPATSPAS